jgi:hypothetical protein
VRIVFWPNQLPRFIVPDYLLPSLISLLTVTLNPNLKNILLQAVIGRQHQKGEQLFY